ncbi:MAG: cell wall metabolism sensor histidine kinase WalK, partial [Candidatus Obscuribacterales bacterium]|nr:cell wall metabolism sensor histidine kinase WalK [Candidatus Obscuribacterales bacterium]
MKSNSPASQTASNSGQDPIREPIREPISEPNRERNWIAEVSHELRLPIANIKLLVDTLLDGALEDRQTCQSM